MMVIMVVLGIIILTGLILIIWTWYHPESLLIPLNLLYLTDPSHRTKFYTESERNNIFPAGAGLEAIWEDIRSEGYALYESLSDKNINYLDQYNINIGEENKRNWTTIPLRLFGRDSPLYLLKCPKLSSVLLLHPEIKSCLFSIMDPGKIIQPHVGPYDGLLRYQLGLDIPMNYENGTSNDLGDGECYLHVGGERYYWKNGQGVLFDESNLHGAVNTTQSKRMVLLIDIERPYFLFPYTLLNKIIITCMGLLPATKQALLI